jgi:muconolactone delta-isomerase
VNSLVPVRGHTLSKEIDMKFLVLWRIEISRLSADMLKAVLTMPDHAKPLEEQGKVLSRYHIVGGHGGAWIYEVESNEELEMLLARSPVYNFSRYEVYPLADMAALPLQSPE